MEFTKEYLAGFFDSKGCVLVTKETPKNRHMFLRVCFSSYKHHYFEDIFTSIVNTYGGCITSVSLSNNKILSCLQLTELKAVSFLQDIYPFVKNKSKKDQIKIALHWIDTRPVREGGYSCNNFKNKPFTYKELHYRQTLPLLLQEMKKRSFHSIRQDRNAIGRLANAITKRINRKKS